jgi:ketosteroid isomerase-like protein
MAGENVEVVRRTYAEWERGHMTAGVELFDSEIVFESFMPDANERVVANGPEEVEAFMREFLGNWRDYRLIGEEFREVGKDKVFVAGHQAATGRQSGVAVEGPMCSVWTFRNCKVVGLVCLNPIAKQPLKPPGLRSRRCRRRNWRWSCAGAPPHVAGGIRRPYASLARGAEGDRLPRPSPNPEGGRPSATRRRRDGGSPAGGEERGPTEREERNRGAGACYGARPVEPIVRGRRARDIGGRDRVQRRVRGVPRVDAVCAHEAVRCARSVRLLGDRVQRRLSHALGGLARLLGPSRDRVRGAVCGCARRDRERADCEDECGRAPTSPPSPEHDGDGVSPHSGPPGGCGPRPHPTIETRSRCLFAPQCSRRRRFATTSFATLGACTCTHLARGR